MLGIDSHMNLIDAFAPLESKICISSFLLSISFSRLLIDNFGDTEQTFMLTTKKSLTTFPFCLLCQQPYTKSQSPKEIFYPSGLYDDWRMGPGDF